jgi:hypothetical protein
MSDLSMFLAQQKKAYLEAQGETGGTAAGFREWVKGLYVEDELRFTKLVLDATMEATTKQWERPPRKHGPDLFEVAGFTVPESLTRPAHGYVTGEELASDDEDAFEKVDQKFATVQDFRDDAMLKMRKAAQSAAVAEQEMKAADEAWRRAHGDASVLLREIADAMATHEPA